MKARVTEEGVLIPKKMLQGIEEVEICQEQNVIFVVPVTPDDPIFQLGTEPVMGDMSDAAESHDLYIYNR